MVGKGGKDQEKGKKRKRVAFGRGTGGKRNGRRKTPQRKMQALNKLKIMHRDKGLMKTERELGPRGLKKRKRKIIKKKRRGEKREGNSCLW